MPPPNCSPGQFCPSIAHRTDPVEIVEKDKTLARSIGGTNKLLSSVGRRKQQAREQESRLRDGTHHHLEILALLTHERSSHQDLLLYRRRAWQVSYSGVSNGKQSGFLSALLQIATVQRVRLWRTQTGREDKSREEFPVLVERRNPGFDSRRMTDGEVVCYSVWVSYSYGTGHRLSRTRRNSST